MPTRRHRNSRLFTIDNLLIAFFVITLLLGAYGWHYSPVPALAHPPTQLPPQPTGIFAAIVATVLAWADDIYRTLQMFTLNYDHPVPELEPNWHPDLALFLARFFAAFFLITTLLVKFSLRVRNACIKFAYGPFFHEPQYLIIGYGRVGQGLARALKGKHPKSRVVAIDRNVSALDRQAADDAGIDLYEADAQDISSFANVPIDITRITKTLVSVGRDQQTIATASRLVDRYRDDINPVWMQLNDWTLLDRLRNSTSLSVAAKGQRKLRSFSMAEALGTQIIARYRPALMAQSFGQNRLHAVLIRFDDFVWAIAEALILNGTSPPPRLSRPRLTIIDYQADQQQQRWLARHPVLHRWVDVQFHHRDPTTLSFSAEEPLLLEAETLDPPTLYIFGRSGDGDALADALALRHGMEKGFRQPAPVFITSEVEGIDRLDLRTIPANLQDRLEILGADAEMAKYSHVIDPWFETLSEYFFSAYITATPDKDEAGKIIKETPETLKNKYLAQEETLQVSNRRAAIHATQILAWLGFEHANATEDRLALPQESGLALAKLFTQAAENPSPGCRNWKEMWAIYEHMRWCADRAIDGWRHGPRDDESRRRNQMHRGRYDYLGLGDTEIGKDIAQAEATKNLLSEPRPAPTCSLTRTQTIELPWPLTWHYESNALILKMDKEGDWPPLAAGENQRIVLQVPPEPTVKTKDPALAAFAALPPIDRKTLRLAAYWNFIEKELPCDPPSVPRRRFRLSRSGRDGWHWLDKGINPNFVEGCTLPPLTIGFAGAPGIPAGNQETIKTNLAKLLDQLSAKGRPMRLITGAGEGIHASMIRLWRTSDATRDFPIIILSAAASPKPDCKIAEHILRADQRSEAFETAPSEQDPDLLEEMGERILNACDHLIVFGNDRSPGKADETAEHAALLKIPVHRIASS